MSSGRLPRILPVLLILLIAASRGSAVEADRHSWPLFRAGSLALGVAPGSLPQKLYVLWTFSSEGVLNRPPRSRRERLHQFHQRQPPRIVLDSGKQRWAFKTDLGFNASPAVREGLVYIGDVDGRFYCIAADGGKRWQFDAGAEINSGANFYKDKVLFGSQDGLLYCLDSATGRLAWKYESEDQIRCFPTIVENRAFVAGCDARLHLIDLDRGEQVANVELESPTGSTPAVLADLLFVGTEGSIFYAIDWKTPKVVWQFAAERRRMPFRGSAAATAAVVVVGSMDKNLYALEPKTGKLLWTFPTRGRIEGSPVVVGRAYYRLGRRAAVCPGLEDRPRTLAL